MTLVDSLVTGGTTMIAMIIFTDFRLTIIALLPLPFLALGAWKLGDKLHYSFDKSQAAFSHLNNKTQESVSGIKVLKAFGESEQDSAAFNKMVDDTIQINKKVFKWDSMFDPLGTLIIGATYVITIIYGGLLVSNRTLSVGQLVSFIAYISNMVWPMFAIGYLFNILERGSASYDRVERLLYEKPQITDENADQSLTARDIQGDLKYEIKDEKIDGDNGQPLQGAEFKVINEDGEIIIPSLISNEEGKLSGEIPQSGTYYLVETKAPNGYQLLKDQISFEILESTIGQTISIGTIENHPKGEEPNTGSLEITKIDLGSKELLSGAIFEIKNLAGEVVQRGETKDGYLTFENLPYGSYTYQEVQAPPGYHLDSTVYPFEINEMTSNIQVTVTNRKNNIFDQLPETGGMGTTIFTMVGGSLLLGGAVIQERNKRKKISK